MLSRLFSQTILVEDLAAATLDYVKLLGREPVWRGRAPDAGTAIHAFQIGGFGLEISSVVEPGIFSSQIVDALDRNGEGQFALSLETESCEALVASLRRKGLETPAPLEMRAQGADGFAERRMDCVFFPPSVTRDIPLLAIELGDDYTPDPESPLTADPASCVEAVDHVVILSQDPDATARLYGSQLGIRLALDRTFEERGVRLLFFRLGGVTIEVAARVGESPQADASDRYGGIAWRVPDVDAAHARIEGHGFRVSPVRGGNKPGTRVFTVQSRTHGVPTLVIGPA